MRDPHHDDAPAKTPQEGGQPRRSRLKRILDEQPEARPRLGKAIAALLGTVVLAVAAIGFLLIWHVARRARLIRERLNPPRGVPPLEWPDTKAEEKVDRPS